MTNLKKRDFKKPIRDRADQIFNKIKSEGLNAIDDFIITRKSEELFLDFKRSVNNGSGKHLDHRDRETLSRSISGFGNSEGGVIVWGIECSESDDYADVAHTKYPLENAIRFLSWIEDAVSSCTIPPHNKVQNHYIETNSEKSGFVVTYIPKSDYAPHQVIVTGKYQYHYYIRAGSSFVATPHSVLAGMFGKRPEPFVYPMFTLGPAKYLRSEIIVEIGIMISNDGPGIASDIFINATIASGIGKNCKLFFKPANLTSWEGQHAFGAIMNLISKKDVRLAPHAFVQPLIIEANIQPPFESDLIIDINCGCGQSPPYKFDLGNKRKAIEEAYNELIDSGINKESNRHDFTRKVFGLTD